MTIKVRPAKGAGAYIDNIELNDIDDAGAAVVRQALGEHGVLFFRDQSLTPERHIALAEKFGQININRFFAPLPDYPQIAQVLKEATHNSNIGGGWHTDHSYDQIPALGSILVAQEVPATGGDTLFVSMFAAHEGLPESLKKQIEGLEAIHSSRHVFGAKAYEGSQTADKVGRLGNAEDATQDAVHPIVIKHPISGKRGLYVNPEFTVSIKNLNAVDSQTLLDTLYAHCSQETFQHRFKWHAGSVAFWDNRATWHRALNDYPNQRRFMHRITIDGVRLEA